MRNIDNDCECKKRNCECKMRNIDNDCGRCIESGDDCSQVNVRYSEFWESTECKAWRDDSPNYENAIAKLQDSRAERDESYDVWAEMQADRFEMWYNEY